MRGLAFALVLVAGVGATPPGCECVGGTAALEGDALTRYGSKYGQWCASWDDGICTLDSTEGPRHTCGGTHTSSCDKLWPDLDWKHSDNLKCCDAWCFVNATSCNASAWGIDMTPSVIKSDLFVSYGACPDWHSRSTYPPDGAVDLAQFDQEGCPYRRVPPGCNCLGLAHLNAMPGWREERIGSESYGSWCAAWDDGVFTEGATEATPGFHPPSSLGNCTGRYPSFNWNTDQTWCCDAFCYVNVTCDAEKHGIDMSVGWTWENLYFSFAVCADSFTRPIPKPRPGLLDPGETPAIPDGYVGDVVHYNDETCPWRAVLPGCECIGDNTGIGRANKDTHGQDYGEWCAAWEDGACTDNASPDSAIKGSPGAHTCRGTLAHSCEAHWPQGRNFSEPQEWCCDAWCYVDPKTCNATKWGIDVEPSWLKPTVFFSYGACADAFSGPSKGGPQNFATYNKETCPYSNYRPYVQTEFWDKLTLGDIEGLGEGKDNAGVAAGITPSRLMPLLLLSLALYL